MHAIQGMIDRSISGGLARSIVIDSKDPCERRLSTERFDKGRSVSVERAFSAKVFGQLPCDDSSAD